MEELEDLFGLTGSRIIQCRREEAGYHDSMNCRRWRVLDFGGHIGNELVERRVCWRCHGTFHWGCVKLTLDGTVFKTFG
jgi:hypothetical protein